MLWVHTCDALVHALLLRSERGCSVTQHQVNARQSACTHEKEDLTTSRFVRVIYSSHIVSIKLGTVTPLRRCGLQVNVRWDGQAPAWRCYPHAPRRCLARQASLLLPPRVSPLLDREDRVSRLQAHPGTAAYAQSGKVHVSHLHNPRIEVRRSSPLPLLSDIAASFIAGRRSLTASSLNMSPRCYRPTTLI